MPCKSKEQQAGYARKHYLANTDKLKARAVRYKAEQRCRLQAHVNSLKSSTPCADCKKHFHPCIMDFDHVRGTKRNDVSTLVNRAVSFKVLNLEIAKCELVCSNCHRMRTFTRQHA